MRKTDLFEEVFLRTIPCAAGLWKEDRSQCLLNSLAVTLFGFEESNVATVPLIWPGQVHGEDREAYAEFLNRIEKEHSPSSCDYRLFTKNALTPLWIREISAPITANMPNCRWQKASVYMDISDLWGYPSFGPSRGKMDDIIDGLFHDTQNNIHRIAMELELARMGLADASDVTNTYEMIGRLQNDVKDLRGYISPLQEPSSSCDPVAVLESVFANWQMGNRHRSITIKWTLPESLPVVPLDRKLFGRVMERVLDFCINLMQEVGEVRIAAERQERTVHICTEIKLAMISATPMKMEAVEGILGQTAEYGQTSNGVYRALEVLRRHHGKISFLRNGDSQCELIIRLEASPR